MNTTKSIICAYVQTPGGTRILCEVKEIIPSFFSLLPQVAVKAIEGRPFNGQKIAIVKMENTFFTASQKAS